MVQRCLKNTAGLCTFGCRFQKDRRAAINLILRAVPFDQPLQLDVCHITNL
jgi:hypothetical protein